MQLTDNNCFPYKTDWNADFKKHAPHLISLSILTKILTNAYRLPKVVI